MIKYVQLNMYALSTCTACTFTYFICAMSAFWKAIHKNEIWAPILYIVYTKHDNSAAQSNDREESFYTSRVVEFGRT